MQCSPQPNFYEGHVQNCSTDKHRASFLDSLCLSLFLVRSAQSHLYNTTQGISTTAYPKTYDELGIPRFFFVWSLLAAIDLNWSIKLGFLNKFWKLCQSEPLHSSAFATITLVHAAHVIPGCLLLSAINLILRTTKIFTRTLATVFLLEQRSRFVFTYNLTKSQTPTFRVQRVGMHPEKI